MLAPWTKLSGLMQTNHPRKCDCKCHRPGMEVKHMVACCCSHGYSKYECPQCEAARRTAADGIPRYVTRAGKVMKYDWILSSDAVYDQDELEGHIENLLEKSRDQDTN